MKMIEKRITALEARKVARLSEESDYDLKLLSRAELRTMLDLLEKAGSDNDRDLSRLTTQERKTLDGLLEKAS